MISDDWDQQPHRRGLTRTEVVVVIVIMVICCAVLLPSIFQNKHTTPRKMECLNNIRQVGFAHLVFPGATNGKSCSLQDETDLENSSGQFGKLPTPWPIQLLPLLDSLALLKNIRKHAVPTTDHADSQIMSIADSEKVFVPVFTCPADSDSFRRPGGLSYVANAGFMARSLFHGDPHGFHRLGHLSWDDNDVPDEEGDRLVSAATGVFWRKDHSGRLSLVDISQADGASQTLLLVENLQAGLWYDTDTAKIGFGLPVETKDSRVLFGSGTLLESVAAPLNTRFANGILGTAGSRDWQINADLKAEAGTRPRPSSRHEGGINAVFADGSCRFLSERIDPHVYIQLLTPAGTRYGEGKLIESGF